MNLVLVLTHSCSTSLVNGLEFLIHLKMVALKSPFVALSTLLATSYAAPTDIAGLDKRATVLADGTAVVVGNLPDWSLIFRASG